MKSYREACYWDIRVAGVTTAMPFAVAELEIEYRAWRGVAGYQPKDIDNALAACKQIPDALKEAGVIVSDAKKSLEWGQFQLITTRREIERAGKLPGISVIVRSA